MRVLVLHSRYQSGHVSGENAVVADETRLLREAGHDVVLLDPEVEGLTATLRAVPGTVWDARRVRDVRKHIREHQPDVLHVHNLFPALSPAVIRAAHDARVPIVMTLHNFRLLCLPGTLFRSGRVCEDCVGRLPFAGVVHRCYRDSRIGSAALASSLALHRKMGTFDLVARFLAVSEFVARKHEQAGLDPDRITVKPNFSWPASVRVGPGSHFLCLGRLSPEKGVGQLLELWRPRFGKLIVAGAGPEDARLAARATSGVELRGPVSPDAARQLIAGSRAVLVPSVWYEAFPRVVVEAYAAGVPVIASRTGALAEAVEEGTTGLLAETGDLDSWIVALEQLLSDATSKRLGRGAYRRWGESYAPQKNLEVLTATYEDIA